MKKWVGSIYGWQLNCLVPFGFTDITVVCCYTISKHIEILTTFYNNILGIAGVKKDWRGADN